MVGVPGRSKGCNTCRQRRVKCTEERPVCSRCTRGGFTCRGYTRETLWRHLTTEPPSSAEGSIQGAPSQLVLIESPKPVAREKAKTTAQARRYLIPKQMSLDAFEEDFCFAYIFSNFVWRGYGASWLHQSAQGLVGQLAFDSVKALAEINFGRSQGSFRTEIQGRIKYGKALRCMIERLGQGQNGNLRDLLIPILLLLMHTATLTNRFATMFHLQGMTQVLAACGPQVFQHQPLRDAYEAARATIVVASLIMRKRVFLDDPVWHSGPYALVPQSKAPQSYLLDILTSVPGFLEEYHKLEKLQERYFPVYFSCNIGVHPTCTDPSHEAMPNTVDDASIEDILKPRADIVKRVVAKLEYLFVWRLHWQVAFGSDVWSKSDIQNLRTESHFYSAPNDLAGSHLDNLQFSRPAAAADIALYNAVLMWLLALINELEPLEAQYIVQTCARRAMLSMSDTEFSFTSGPATTSPGLTSFQPLWGIGSTTRVRDAALEICRVFEWQSANHGSTWETNFVYMFPIGLALCVLDTEPEYRNWIRSMLDADALTRDYGADHVMDGDSLHHASNTDHLSLTGNFDVGIMGGLELEMGILHQLQGFAWYVTRELPDSDNKQADGHHETIVEERSHDDKKTPDPNLVHLLLLRGRMDVSSS